MILEKYRKEMEKEINKEIDKLVNRIVGEIMKDFKGDTKEKKKKIKKIMKIFFKAVYKRAREEIKKIFLELIVKGNFCIYIDENKIDKEVLQKLKEGNWSPKRIEVLDKSLLPKEEDRINFIMKLLDEQNDSLS